MIRAGFRISHNKKYVFLSMAPEYHRLPPAQSYQVENAVPAKARSTDALTCIKPLFYHLHEIYLQGDLTTVVQSSVLLIKPWPLKECFKHSMNIPLLLH